MYSDSIGDDNMAMKVRIVFEVMGWPADALNPSLKQTIDLLRDNKWKILKEEYGTPEKLGEKMFSSFVEFETEVPTMQDFFAFAINFAPSVIEILEPFEFEIKAGELQDIIADLCAKIQSIDKEVKFLSAENKIMRARLQSITPETEPEESPKKRKKA